MTTIRGHPKYSRRILKKNYGSRDHDIKDSYLILMRKQHLIPTQRYNRNARTKKGEYKGRDLSPET